MSTTRFQVVALEVGEGVKFWYNVLKVKPREFHWKEVVRKSEESKRTPTLWV